MKIKKSLLLLISLLCVIAFGAGGCEFTCEEETISHDYKGFDDYFEVPRNPGRPLKPIWDQVRDGHWVHAVNMPWDNYGSDFGTAPWGYLGLGSQGPSGWRCESKPHIQGCERLFIVRWDGPGGSDSWLAIETKLWTHDSKLSNGIVYFYLDENANMEKGEFLNLAGDTVQCKGRFPRSLEGPEDAPNGAVLFLQDVNWNWIETPWWNIKHTNEKLFSMKVESTIDFDARNVRAIGIKIATNDSAKEEYIYNDNFYIDDVLNQDGEAFQFSFDNNSSRTENELLDLASLGVTAVRWWIFADGRSGLEFDDDGYVKGLGENLINDFDEAILLARASGLYLVPVLFDFLLGAEPSVTEDTLTGDTYQIFGHSDLINDPLKRQSLMQNAIEPLFLRYGDRPEILAWDLMNEPEWLVINDEEYVVIPEDMRPKEILSDGAVTFNEMFGFLSEILDQYPNNTEGYEQLFTLGSASVRWVNVWENLSLDIVQFHFWNGLNQIDDGAFFDFPPPIAGTPNVLGEFNCTNDCGEMIQAGYDLGYTGVWPWAYRAKDDESAPTLGTECRQAIEWFATQYPEVVDF